MEITCPNCATGYHLADATIGSEGRLVRCARCANEWRALPGAAALEAAGPPLPDHTETALSAALEDALRKPDAPKTTAGLPATTASQPMAARLPAIRRRFETTIAGIGPGFERFRKPHPSGKARPRPRKSVPLAERAGPPAIAAVLLLLVGAVLARQPIVSAWPDLAGLYGSVGLKVNLRGLEFRRLTAIRDIENGQPILIVEGEIANIAGSDNDLPAVRLALRSGRQEIYAWSVQPTRQSLHAGETIGFRTRLATPPLSADDLELRFAARRLLASGAP